jgi:hypothetical protein
MTQAHKIVDGSTHYIVILDHLNDGPDLSIHSCWRFYPGRTVGERTSISSLPWSDRQRLSELTNDPLP